MPNTITKNETVVQCSPIACMVAGATLNEESNAEALDTYTACGCEGASGLKNLLGGAAPFLIPLAAGFAVHGEENPRLQKELQELSTKVAFIKTGGDFFLAAQLQLKKAKIYKGQHDLQGELTELTSADESAKKIKNEGTRNNLRAEILEKMSDAQAELTDYGWAVDKMMESLKLSASEARYKRLVKLIDLGVTAGDIADFDGDAIRGEANEIWFSAAGRGKKAKGPAIDKGVEGQWVSDLAKDAQGAKRVGIAIMETVKTWLERAEKMAATEGTEQLDAASRLYEKAAHLLEGIGALYSARDAYEHAAEAINSKDIVAAPDLERMAGLYEAAACEPHQAQESYKEAGLTRLDAAEAWAEAGELVRAAANIRTAISYLTNNPEVSDHYSARLEGARGLLAKLMERLSAEAPGVREHYQVRVMASIINEYLKGIEEGWDQLPYEQKLVRMETVQKAIAFALKNHPKELEPFIREGGGQGRVLNAKGCKKAMELWVKTTDRMERGSLRTGGADPVVDGVVNSLLGRYGDTSDLSSPRRPKRPGKPERPTAIGAERGERGGRTEGKGRDGREDRGAEGQGRARKGLRVR